MIEENHAVKYHGQSKEAIAEEHIANRAKVEINMADLSDLIPGATGK